MSNMSYCQFENTYHNLRDIYNHIHDNDLSEEEQKYRSRLIELCQKIANNEQDEEEEEGENLGDEIWDEEDEEWENDSEEDSDLESDGD